MGHKSMLTRVATAVAISVGLAGPVLAQETSSSISGKIMGPQGNPAAGTTITVTHTPSGTTKQVIVGDNGQFNARGLRVGGPYKVEVDSSTFEDKTVNDVFLSLGETYNLDLALEPEQTMENIVVTASQVSNVSFGEKGPSVNFSLEQLESAPAINRNISDVVRIDARIYVDESRGDINSIQCAGKNPRFNSLTVDGVRMNDSFGLNSNGYPTERMPFSYDAIEQVAVELAPFDVQYGGFTACNINAVTKSGSNEIHGSFFYDYTSDSLKGDSLEGDDVRLGKFSEKRMGFNLGGSLIEDKLYFFAAYEKLEGANLFDRGAIGSGAVNEVAVTQAELDEIVNISKTLYQYDPGGIPSSMPNEDEKLLVKLDWNISDEHRMSFTYNYNDGNNFTESDGDRDEFEFSNHLYERGAELNSYVLALYSDWTDKFSTELRIGYLDLENRQRSVGGTDFGEIQISLDDVTVYLGGDDSRQSNELNYDLTNFTFKGQYYMDNGHNLSFGLERESLDVFNLFVQHTETEIRFYGGIDSFRDGLAGAIYYNNAPSNNPEDAAADWGYALNTAYIQDEFSLTDDLTVIAGVRYDWYTSSDKPEENPVFVADYGFSNSTNLDGEGLFQPRIGFTYNLSDDITMRGGVGLYSGGNPNVWLSNNFSANNVLQFGQRGRSFGYTNGSRSLFDADVVYVGLEEGVPAGPGYGIPSELYNAVAGGDGDNFEINYLDPDFKLPSEWKYALGMTYILPQDYVLNADLLVTSTQDAAIVLHGDIEKIGADENGYPIYDSVREGTFVLTNSDTSSTSVSISGSISKSYDNGLDWLIGYAYSDAEDIQPMTSSVAISNYTLRAFFDPEEQVSSTSNYNIEHRLTGLLNWKTNLIGDYETRVTLFGSLNSGQPYSLTYDSSNSPISTPYLDGQDAVLLPGEARNAHTGSSWGKLDLRISQELPGFAEGHSASAFLVVDNLSNLLNDDWGVLYQVDFPNTVTDASDPESRVGDASLYEIRVGVNYKF
ncbi:TonB-dependent receptor [Alteromonadaceae bacterium BrNp21-10]|nr:TonB-dependent receptor [Alteromonadaceae bacterium BrNp21-10]